MNPLDLIATYTWPVCLIMSESFHQELNQLYWSECFYLTAYITYGQNYAPQSE